MGGGASRNWRGRQVLGASPRAPGCVCRPQSCLWFSGPCWTPRAGTPSAGASVPGRTAPPSPRLSHLHAAQQGSRAAMRCQAENLGGSLQAQASQGLHGPPAVQEQGLRLGRPPVGTCPQQHALLSAPWGQEGSCCCPRGSAGCRPAVHTTSSPRRASRHPGALLFAGLEAHHPKQLPSPTEASGPPCRPHPPPLCPPRASASLSRPHKPMQVAAGSSPSPPSWGCREVLTGLPHSTLNTPISVLSEVQLGRAPAI